MFKDAVENRKCSRLLHRKIIPKSNFPLDEYNYFNIKNYYVNVRLGSSAVPDVRAR